MFLRRLFKSKRAQSTAEYGIIFAAVIAIAAGALSVSLKNAINVKQDRAVEFMLRAGTSELDDAMEEAGFDTMQDVYAVSEQVRHTTSLETGYTDEKIRLKGGAEMKHNETATETTTLDINRLVEEGE